MFTDALPEFRADWMLAGKAETTIDFYVNLLHLLGAEHPLPSLYDVKTWVGVAATIPIRRKRLRLFHRHTLVRCTNTPDRKLAKCHKLMEEQSMTIS